MRGNRRYSFILVPLAVVFLGAISTSHLVSSALAQTDERLEKLPADQKQLAERMLKFMSDMDKRYFERAYALNGNSQSETKEIPSDYSDYDLKVTRGPVVQKMGRMLAAGKKPAQRLAWKETLSGGVFILSMHILSRPWSACSTPLSWSSFLTAAKVSPHLCQVQHKSRV
jgi:hypothetical protein